MISIKYDKDLFKKQLDILEYYNAKNPFVKSKEKVISNVVSEIHNSLITEGEFSSRREIKEAYKGHQKENIGKQHYENYIQGYGFVTNNKDISCRDISALYSTLTRNVEMGKEGLEGDEMFRSADVTIGSSSYNGETHYGAKPNEITNELNQLIDYIKNGDEDSIVIRSIVSHFFFELIHPFYDYNGRTGRLLVQWVMSIRGEYKSCLRYFATAVGSYREKYLKSFSTTVKKQSEKNKYNRDYKLNDFIEKTLYLLMLNQYQYDYISELESNVNNNKQTLKSNDKLLILAILKRYEIQNSSGTWLKANQLKEDVESVMIQSQFSKLINDLVDKEVLEKIDSKPMKVKFLNDYTLFKDSKIYKKLA